MSIRYDPNFRPLMLIGQDENCFKQFSFLKRYWIGPTGEVKLLSKTNSYIQLVLAFCSCSFGIDLDLEEEGMEKRNEGR